MRHYVCLLALLAAPLLRAAETATPARVITLEDAYDMAAATDQSIRIAYEKIRMANLLPWSAIATNLGPQLTGAGEYDANQTHARGLYTIVDTSNISLTYTQPLLSFGVFPAYRYGKLSATYARLEHQFTIRQVLFSVASAYYQVLTDEGTVAVDQKTVDLAGQQLDVAQKRLNVGEVTPTDALNAKVTLESAKVALIQAKNALLLDRDTLGNLLNLGGDSGFQLVIPPDYPTTIPEFEKLLAIAYRSREDIAAANMVIGQDYAKRGEVLAEYVPSVVGVASDTYQNGRGFYGPQNQVWDANVTVTMPFFTGGEREIDLKNSDYQVNVDRLNRESAVKTVEAGVRQAWLKARSLQESLESLRVQVAAARESYEDEEHEYQAGTAASVDVLTALVNLNTSENSLEEQVYLYQVALRGLEQAAGVFQEQRVLREMVK